MLKSSLMESTTSAQRLEIELVGSRKNTAELANQLRDLQLQVQLDRCGGVGVGWVRMWVQVQVQVQVRVQVRMQVKVLMLVHTY